MEKTRVKKVMKHRVDDIVVVMVSLGTYADCFRRWLKEGRPGGGPEQYLTPAEKKLVFHKVFKDLIDFNEEELERLTE